MKLHRLRLGSFRNVDQADLVCPARFNILHGANGQGKTNLLEAIFLLGTLKSFRHARTSELITWQQPQALVRGTIDAGGVSRQIGLLLERSGKKVLVDQKPVSRHADFHGVFPVIAFAPDELIMVRGTPETRRRYLDRAVFSSDLAYLTLYHDYYRVLKNRNALLRRGDYRGLEVWSEQLVQAGARLTSRRRTYLTELSGLFSPFYRLITGSDEAAGVCYHPHPVGASSTDYAELLRAALAKSTSEEQRRGTTLAGPHRDDLDFVLNGRPLRVHGSQGQQKSFVLALKMAEIELLRRTAGSAPVLLLDDMAAELDRQRISHLLRFIGEHDMQVFITTTDPAMVPVTNRDDCATFRVEGGGIVQEGCND